jgi:hypothetical protein
MPAQALTVRVPDHESGTLTIATTELVELADSAVGLAASVQVTDDASVADAREIMKEIGDLSKAIDKRREDVKAPYWQACKLIDAQAKPIVTKLDALVAQIKSKLATYAMDIERRRLEALAAQARIESQAQDEVAGTARTPVINTAVVIPDAAPIPMRTTYEVTIRDAAQIPRQFLVPDKAAIEAEFKAGRFVEGCTYDPKRTILNR